MWDVRAVQAEDNSSVSVVETDWEWLSAEVESEAEPEPGPEAIGIELAWTEKVCWWTAAGKLGDREIFIADKIIIKKWIYTKNIQVKFTLSIYNSFHNSTKCVLIPQGPGMQKMDTFNWTN